MSAVTLIHSADIFFFVSYFRVKLVDNYAQTNFGVDRLEHMGES